jgi:hypothetical protein
MVARKNDDRRAAGARMIGSLQGCELDGNRFQHSERSGGLR